MSGRTPYRLDISYVHDFGMMSLQTREMRYADQLATLRSMRKEAPEMWAELKALIAQAERDGA